MNLEFDIVERGREYFVRFAVDGGELVEDRFAAELLGGSQVKEKLAAIEDNIASYADINYAGSLLWSALMPEKIRVAYENAVSTRAPGTRVPLRLAIDPALRGLPWEALYNPDTGSLAGDPGYGILRRPPQQASIAPFQRHDGRALSMLCIIPSGSGLNIDHELTNIRREGEKLRPLWRMEPLLGQVDPDMLRDKLSDGPWDIVHYVGHGAVDENDRVTIRFYDKAGGDLWMDAEIFAQQFYQSGVRLVVLNCCYGDVPSPSHYLSGLGPFLMRRGIPAVVAMRYEIADTVAILFSKSFYNALFSSTSPGRVDLALESARAALLRNQQPGIERGFITPVFYLAPGYEQLFNLQASAPTKVDRVLVAVQLPHLLRTALTKRQCIPVIGPGVLRIGAFRRAPLPADKTQARTVPGPRELAETLAADPRCPYPQLQEDFQVSETAGEWMSAQLMHWVCQHYQERLNRGELLQRVLEIYGKLETNEVVKAIANWNVPGMFYTYFDGLMEQCINRGEARLNMIIPRVSQFTNPDSRIGHTQSPLVLVRGSCSDPETLVLTEEDHDEMADGLSRMDPAIAALARQVGRSVLFLGLSPRDPLVRSLSQRLLEAGHRRKQGPTYFVWPTPSDVDEAYWSRYAVEWIKDNAEDVIEAISAL